MTIQTLYRRTWTAGLIGLMAGAVAGQEPAARLLPPQPITPNGPIVSRASGYELPPLTPPGARTGSTPASTPTPMATDTAPKSTSGGGWLTGPGMAPPKPLFFADSSKPKTTEPTTTPEAPGLLRRTWTDVKDYVVGPSDPKPKAGPTTATNPYAFRSPTAVSSPSPQPSPQPRTQPQTPASSPNPYAFQTPSPSPPTPPAATAPIATGPGVYATKPAHGWYGWGTTTPGANPHAPNGRHPIASANWLMQSGATPGAYPQQSHLAVVPAAADAPAYAVGGTRTEPLVYPIPQTTIGNDPEVRTASAPTFALPPVEKPAVPPVGIRLVPASAVEPLPPTGPRPIAQSSGSPSVSTPSPEPTPAPAAAGITWQSSPAATPATRTVQPPPPGQWTPARPPAGPTPIAETPAPRPLLLTFDSAVRNAAGPWATVTEVTRTDANRVVIRLTAATDADAEKASQAVSKLPLLKSLEVGFEAKIAPK